jgi:hypothetical protein
MVRNDVEDKPPSMPAEFSDQGAEVALGADLGIDLVVVGDVVAMLAAGSSL